MENSGHRNAGTAGSQKSNRSMGILTVLPDTYTNPVSLKQSKNDKNDKKLLRSPFGVYMAEQRRLLENEGKTFPGWKQLADFLSEKWNLLPEEERLHYKKKSAELRGVEPEPQSSNDVILKNALKQLEIQRAKPKVDTPLGYTTFGEKIIPSAMEVMIEFREYTAIRAKIEGFLRVEIGEQPKKIAEKTIIVVEFNPYCSDNDGTGDIIPGEWAMSTFSIQAGLKTTTSGLINPGRTPIGTSSEIRDNVKMLGLRPITIMASEMENTEENLDESQSVINEICDMSMLWHREGYNRGYIFAMRDSVPIVERCLRWLCKKTGKEMDFDVLSLSVLTEMYSQMCGRGPNYTRTEVESDRLLQKITYAYEESLSCEWHTSKERVNLVDKCARNVVQRVVYNFLDYICPLYNVKMLVPEHCPFTTSVDYLQNEWCRKHNLPANLDSGHGRAISVYSIATTTNSSSSKYSGFSDQESETE